MTLRLAGLAALALLSSACAFTSPATVPQPVDASDSAAYDQPWAPSPDYRSESHRAAVETETASLGDVDAQAHEAAPAKSGNALGTTDRAGTSKGRAGTVAVPGDPCYDAAVKAGITRGDCTMINDRKFVVFGER